MPNRMCIICKERKQKEDLLRIVIKDNKTFLDENQKENTRGVYICNNKKCINRLNDILEKDKDKMKYKIKVNKEELKKIIRELKERMGD